MGQSVGGTDLQNCAHMFECKVLALLVGQQLRSLEDVLDLSTIHFVLSQGVELLFSKPHGIGERLTKVRQTCIRDALSRLLYCSVR